MTPGELICASVVPIDGAMVHFREGMHQTVLFRRESGTEDNVVVVLCTIERLHGTVVVRDIRRTSHD
jgi:hypothetical protein